MHAPDKDNIRSLLDTISKLNSSIQQEMVNAGYAVDSGTSWSLYTSAYTLIKFARTDRTNKIINAATYLNAAVEQSQTDNKVLQELLQTLQRSFKELETHISDLQSTNVHSPSSR